MGDEQRRRVVRPQCTATPTKEEGRREGCGEGVSERSTVFGQGLN